MGAPRGGPAGLGAVLRRVWRMLTTNRKVAAGSAISTGTTAWTIPSTSCAAGATRGTGDRHHGTAARISDSGQD